MERYELPNWIPEWAVSERMRIIIAYRQLRTVNEVKRKLGYISPSFVRKVIAEYREFLASHEGVVTWVDQE